MDLIGLKIKLGWMEKGINGFDWMKNEIGLVDKRKGLDWMKIEMITLDEKVKKLDWMEKERQSDWKWKKIESNLKRG
jgi:L-ribulose-5-phosphate 3-epimerase UlaE